MAMDISEYEAQLREKIIYVNLDELCLYVEDAIEANRDVMVPVIADWVPFSTTLVLSGPTQVKIRISPSEASLYTGICEQVKKLRSELVEMLKMVPKLLL